MTDAAESGDDRRRLGLIGEHASEAMSPRLWAPVLRTVRPTWSYEPWDVGADGVVGLRDRLLEGDVMAFNVTMPHKRWAAAAADTASGPVRMSGAANLLIHEAGRLAAHNTDIDAMRAAVRDVEGESATVLGAGGAGRAAVIALRGRASAIRLADPNREALRGTADFALTQGIAVEEVDWEGRGDAVSSSSIAVNATPVGMRATDTAIWGTDDLSAVGLVYDFVYAEHETANAVVARLAGTTLVDGWEHLLRQAQAMIPLLGLPDAVHWMLGRSLAEIRG